MEKEGRLFYTMTTQETEFYFIESEKFFASIQQEKSCTEREGSEGSVEVPYWVSKR